jgi:hypothetical protein
MLGTTASSLALLTFASLAAPIPLQSGGEDKRQGGGLQALQASIMTLQQQLAVANNSVVAYSSDGIVDGLKGLIRVNSAVVKLGDDITAATRTANSTQRLSAQDS